jgi:lipopolysaccharide transport system ATP-binding protein
MSWAWPWRRKGDELVVLDDFFPNLLTGFRVAEYNAYLGAFANLRVLSALPGFTAEHARYAARYPQFASRVERFSGRDLRRAKLAYINFLNNAALFLPQLQERGLPFALTLYPGGGLGLHEAPSDRKLLQVLTSPLLRSLTVTQPVTERYVIDFAAKHGLQLPPLRLVPGVVVNPMYFSAGLQAHGPYFGEAKALFDICFVAEKYMARGENKGYPEFIAMAHALRDEPALRFHVVGSFTADDVDVATLDKRISFSGRIETTDLPTFFHGMDLVVSPNKPFLLHPGNFDGFPTGACVEASLCGVAVMASDALEQNPGYHSGESILIVPPAVDAMVEALRGLLREPGRVASIARAGQALTRRWYAPEVQIGRRREVLEAVAQEVGLALQPLSG